MLSTVFEQFVEESPISVMARVLMERIFCCERLDNIFETHAAAQYQQDLLNSSPSRFNEFGCMRDSVRQSMLLIEQKL